MTSDTDLSDAVTIRTRNPITKPVAQKPRTTLRSGRAVVWNSKLHPSTKRTRKRGDLPYLGHRFIRSPTPPSRIISSQRGNKYTNEDKEFFVKTLAIALRRNPDLDSIRPQVLAKKLAIGVREHCLQGDIMN